MTLSEKAVSKKQQRFFGMVRAAQKGEMEDPSPEITQVASTVSKSDVKKMASTKHKGLPEKVPANEGVINAYKKGIKRHKDSVEKKKIKNRKAVPYAALAAEYSPELPEIEEAKVDKGRSDYGKATIRNWRRSGPSTVEPAMFDPENKRGKTIDKRREEHKARRGVKGAKVPAYKVSEENALEKRAKENEKARKWLKKDAKDSGYTDIALKASMSKGAGVGEEVIPRGPGGNPIRIKDRIKAAKGFIPNKGKPTTEEVVSELNRYGKETGKATGSANKRAGTPVKTGGSTDDKALTFVRNMIRKETGKPSGQQKKVKGEKGRSQPGDRKFSPADTIAKVRQSRKDADAAMRDTRGT